MNNCYLLLRNNKETGPLSVTELLQLSLTDNDLVWVQGKSAGWRYPFEVEELKGVVAGNHQPSQSTTNKKEGIIPTDVKNEQKTPSKKIFVSLPSVVKKQAPHLTPSFEEKAEALRQKALSFSEQNEEVTEVTYSRSLSDIKEEYSEWIQEQKKNRKQLNISKPLAFTVLFVAITAATFFVLQWNPEKKKAGQAFTPAVEKSTPVTNSQTINTVAYKIAENKPATTTKQLPAEKPPEKNIAKTVVSPATIKQSVSTPVKTKEAPFISAPRETVLRNEKAEIPIADLIETTSQYIQSKDGIGLTINLRNKSGKSIRVAAIDVMYLDKAKAQTGKETLYFSNLQPGSTMTKNSSFVKAASASYRIGLVSAESAGLYVMQ